MDLNFFISIKFWNNVANDFWYKELILICEANA